MNYHKLNTRNHYRFTAASAAVQNCNKENHQLNGEGVSPLKKKSPKTKK
jgi:hypothetical protein